MSRFGFSTEPSQGGDFLPIVKYDARAGRMFRVDRVDTGGQFVSEPVDITSNFKAIFDLENVETGWINFSTGGAPDFRLVPIGEPLMVRPSEMHKNGIRFMLKLSKDCGGDRPIREIAGTSKAFLSGVEKVFDDYDAQKAEHPGQLPVVVMEGSMPIKSGSGDRQSTNYVPKFKVVGWAPRGDLVFQSKGQNASPLQPAQNGGQTSSATPPSTGSTRVDPPAARQPEPSVATADSDFG
jgi:hypothetical protein